MANTGRWTRLKYWVARRNTDHWIYRHRSEFALLIGVCVVGQLVAIVVGLDVRFHWPSGWLPPVSISDQVEALLATGTLALAFAALVQAVGGLEATRRSHRPSLVLSALPLGGGTGAAPGNQGLQGARLVIQNVGTGFAKDVRCSWFRYPETPEAKNFIKAIHISAPATGVLGAYRTYLGTSSQDDWEVPLDQDYPGMDFIVELAARDVFDEESYAPRYHIRHSPGTPEVSVGVWTILLPPGNDPERIPTIQQMIARGKTYPPPYHWDV